jgi:hypothetical protein
MKKLIVELFLKDERKWVAENGMWPVKNFVPEDVVCDMNTVGVL